MISTMLSAALLGGVTLVSCPTGQADKQACDAAAVKVTNVALTEKADDCSTPCEGVKAACDAGVAVTNVAMTSDAAGDCAKACDGAKAACDSGTAVVSNVAMASDAKSDCASVCDSAKAACDAGVAVTNVAMTGDDKADCATACSTTKTASILAASMPGMSYRVGETDTNCPMSAQTMASEHGKPMHYVVSNVAYETEAQAKVAHEAAMLAYADSLTRVVYNVKGETMCAESAAKACESVCTSEVKYQVGPVIFDNAEDAVRAAAMAYSAMQSVAMTYEVAGEATHCSTDAANKASSCSSPVEYVVNGKHTTCKQSAQSMLTRERVAAAMNAVQSVAG
jgi:hypothetical protein